MYAAKGMEMCRLIQKLDQIRFVYVVVVLRPHDNLCGLVRFFTLSRTNYRQGCLHSSYNSSGNNGLVDPRVNILCLVSSLNVHEDMRGPDLDYKAECICVRLCVGADHPELHAQVPAQVPHSAGQRHPEAPLQHLQDLRVPGDRVCGRDCVSERQGETPFTLNRLAFIIWLLLCKINALHASLPPTTNPRRLNLIL